MTIVQRKNVTMSPAFVEFVVSCKKGKSNSIDYLRFMTLNGKLVMLLRMYVKKTGDEKTVGTVFIDPSLWAEEEAIKEARALKSDDTLDIEFNTEVKVQQAEPVKENKGIGKVFSLPKALAGIIEKCSEDTDQTRLEVLRLTDKWAVNIDDNFQYNIGTGPAPDDEPGQDFIYLIKQLPVGQLAVFTVDNKSKEATLRRLSDHSIDVERKATEKVISLGSKKRAQTRERAAGCSKADSPFPL